MTHTEAMSGREVSPEEAIRELRDHGLSAEASGSAVRVWAEVYHPEDGWTVEETILPLRSAEILAYLGY